MYVQTVHTKLFFMFSESLLQINDELNTSFTRYDRHMKNRQAVLQQPQQVSEDNVTPLFVPLTSDV